MPIKIFFCYIHKDKVFVDRLKMHLRPLERKGLIDIWQEVDISTESNWEREVWDNLFTAQMILLLISLDFINSDFCYGIEMNRLIERHERGEARVIPVILRPSLWNETPLSKLQALPSGAKPITDPYWNTQDRGLHNVAEGIRNIIDEINQKHPIPSTPSIFRIPSIPPTPIIPATHPLTSIIASTPLLGRLPVYLLLDCSESMSGEPIAQVQKVIEMIYNILISDPKTIEIAVISIITISSRADQYAFTPIRTFRTPILVAGGEKNMGEAFRILAVSIEEDLNMNSIIGDYSPLVFLLTDGCIPKDDYHEPLKRLKEIEGSRKPTIVAFCCNINVETNMFNDEINNILKLSEVTSEEIKSYIKYD